MYGPTPSLTKYPPHIPNKNLKLSIFQKHSELMEKTKKGSRNLRQFFEYKHTLNLSNFTSWQVSLDDPSITIVDVNKSLHWLSKAELCQDFIDKKAKVIIQKNTF